MVTYIHIFCKTNRSPDYLISYSLDLDNKSMNYFFVIGFYFLLFYNRKIESIFFLGFMIMCIIFTTQRMHQSCASDKSDRDEGIIGASSWRIGKEGHRLWISHWRIYIISHYNKWDPLHTTFASLSLILILHIYAFQNFSNTETQMSPYRTMSFLCLSS